MTGMHMNIAQRQNSSVSPRLQQAVRLLQMSSLDFAAMVRASLSRNPFLEAEESDETDDGAEVLAAEADSAQQQAQALDGPLDDTAEDEHDPWQSPATGGTQSSSGDEDFSALDSARVQTTLGDHLRGQLNVLNLTARDRALAGAIVEALDDDGYLRVPLDQLLDDGALSPAPADDEWRIALRRVQALDPAGVGARSVAECLQRQLPAIANAPLRALAARIVADHLAALAARQLRGLAGLLGEPLERIEAACDAIRRLDPRPGWRVGSASAAYVVPDVIVRKRHGVWRVRLNPAVMPRVRMNQHYAQLFRAHRTAQHREMAGQLQDARWTLRNVEQRFATIQQIAEAIVRRQSHFLEFGAMAMKPMGLRDIADELGVHESTVSRATHDKYMATPLGVFELKHFFSRAMISTNGRACSGTAIRGLVEEMIHAEGAHAPLSDAAITRQLAEQGLVVARRTVTKYRQMLRIDAVEKRRRA